MTRRLKRILDLKTSLKDISFLQSAVGSIGKTEFVIEVALLFFSCTFVSTCLRSSTFFLKSTCIYNLIDLMPLLQALVQSDLKVQQVVHQVPSCH